MGSLNKCMFIGNVGGDPEMRYMPSGDAMTTISIACTDSWKDKSTGEKKELVEWVRITFFGKLAEIAGQYLKKGSQVYVEGSLRTRKYTDKDGIEKYATDIKADSMQMLGGKRGESNESDDARYSAPPNARQNAAPAPQGRGAAPQNRPASRPAPNFSDMDDDVPF